MKDIPVSCCAIALALFMASPVLAETRYITNQLQIGLHAGKNLASPIIKTLPSGTALTIITKENNVSFVQDAAGASGWIDNGYLVKTDPTNEKIRSAQKKINTLENQLDAAQQQITGPNSRMPQDLEQEKTALKTQLKAEKLKAGQLQAEVSKLRKRIGQNNDNQSLYEQIEKLESDKKNLEVALAISGGDNESELSSRFSGGESGWRNLIIYLFIALLLGLGLGIYFMDFRSRRRHGGFRV